MSLNLEFSISAQYVEVSKREQYTSYDRMRRYTFIGQDGDYIVILAWGDPPFKSSEEALQAGEDEVASWQYNV